MIWIAAFLSLAPQDRYEKLSPFEAVRWKGPAYEVQVGKGWYELRGINDLTIDEIVKFCKESEPRRWEKRLDEDLVEMLSRMGKPPGKTVALKVRTLDTGEAKVLADVLMTEENRKAIWRARQPADDTPVQDLRAGKDENRRYFLIGPNKDAQAPEEGWGLVLILPGGDGSADFNPFCKAIWKQVLSERSLAAELVAPKWTPDQVIVWPTDKNRTKGMKFTTEDFVEAVVADVQGNHRIDPKRVFTLSWSSGGPAAYAASLAGKTSVKGSLVAMSVFSPTWLPPLERAKGHAYYVYHSPDDKVCPVRLAENARDQLRKAGAEVEYATYAGGHGWRGDTIGDLKAGFEWLEKNAKKEK
jgi:predicted esterase